MDDVWRSVELARHQDRPYTLDYVDRLFDDFVELHGDRALARRPGDRRRARPLRRAGRWRSSATRRAATSASGRTGTSACRIRRATARRFASWSSPTGTAFPVFTPRRHARRLSGRGRRAARPGRLDRAVPARHDPARRAHGRVRDRRGRLGRGGGDRDRRPRPHAGERDLLRDLPRGLRGDPLARRGRGEEGRGRVPAGRRDMPRARCGGRRSSPSPKAAPTTDHDEAARLLGRVAGPRRSQELEEARAAQAAPLARRAKFRAMGVFVNGA